jgi:F-box protein 9
VLSRPRAALRQDGVLSGELGVRGALVHTVMTSCHGHVSRLHTWLRLRSTTPGANNRLDVRSMLSVDDGAPEPEEPAAEHDAYSDENGHGWHAAHGGVGAWHEGGAVRTYSRGLTPYVFIPWDQLDSTELNLSTDEMDFYVPG